MEEENDWAVSNLGETDICVLGKYNTVKFYRIKVPDSEACQPPSYFSSPLFKLKKKKKQFSPRELSPLSLNKKGKPWPSQYFAALGPYISPNTISKCKTALQNDAEHAERAEKVISVKVVPEIGKSCDFRFDNLRAMYAAEAKKKSENLKRSK